MGVHARVRPRAPSPPRDVPAATSAPRDGSTRVPRSPRAFISRRTPARAPRRRSPRPGSRDAFASGARSAVVATALDEDDAPADISGRDDDDLDEILVFDDGLDDPFEAIASPASSPVDAAFDAMLDDIVATSPDPVPDSDSDAASAYAQPRRRGPLARRRCLARIRKLPRQTHGQGIQPRVAQRPARVGR